jgi:uncharacterized protein
MQRLTLGWLVACGIAAAQPYQALLIDGQNNHDWQATTPILRAILEESKLFRVTVATTPPKGQDMTEFRPDFARYRVVVSNYNGEPWPAATNADFARYVQQGGGFVSVHAADNAFPEWPDYNEMIGVGGWGNRNEKDGPYVRWRGGRIVHDAVPGRGGSHGKQHAFAVTAREPGHPILAGLPAVWMHVQDELYDRLRGPARNLTVLATAHSDPGTGGTGEHEPVLMTVRYGQGRVFHTTLGHSPEAMSCTGFRTTLQRGAEWAASGLVTQPVPDDFPDAQTVRRREQ